jgi:hypothetical protein
MEKLKSHLVIEYTVCLLGVANYYVPAVDIYDIFILSIESRLTLYLGWLGINASHLKRILIVYA